MTTQVKILGTGCSKCRQTTDIVEEVIKENNLDASIEQVEDAEEILRFNVLSTPAIAINNVITVKGRVPSKKEMLFLLK